MKRLNTLLASFAVTAALLLQAGCSTLPPAAVATAEAVRLDATPRMAIISAFVDNAAFRSLGDLAGGGAGENEMGTFFKIAADNSARVLLAFLAAWR